MKANVSEVSLKKALGFKSIRRFKHASKANMTEWFRQFLRSHKLKKSAKGNHLAPLNAFVKFVKSEFRKLRPDTASGVESGKWKLPCGLTAKKAWEFLEKQFAALRLNLQPAMKDAPKQSPCKGRFQIVPAELNPPMEIVHRRRREPKSTTWERIGGMLVPVLAPESFIRRPSEAGPAKKGPLNRNEKRGQTKPQARR